MFFHRCEDTQVTLYPTGVVVADIALDHMHKLLLAGKAFAVVPFSLQDAPEALHRAIVNAMSYAGHTLGHPGLFQSIVKSPACILETSVTVEQRVCVRIGIQCLVKSIEYQKTIVTSTNCIGNDAPIIQIQNRTQVNFAGFKFIIPLEFGHISQPFFIGLICVKVSVQNIFCKELWIFCLSGASAFTIFDGRFNISGSTNPKHSFVVHMNTLIMPQFIVDPAVTFIRAFSMDLLNSLCKPLILSGPLAYLT